MGCVAYCLVTFISALVYQYMRTELILWIVHLDNKEMMQ